MVARLLEVTTAKRSFETLKSFHAFKKKDPRILPNSERFSQLAQELFTREAKTLQRSLRVYPETDFCL